MSGIQAPTEAHQTAPKVPFMLGARRTLVPAVAAVPAIEQKRAGPARTGSRTLRICGRLSAMDDEVRAAELILRGGTWGGLLFDNPRVGVAPSLTWSFTFMYEDVVRSYGSTTPSLCVDWIPLPGAAWDDMAGRKASGQVFAEPIEASVYFFEHFRYDAADLRILEQVGGDVRVIASVSGDVDRLGIDQLSAEAWLRFTGIIVQLTDAPSAIEEAEQRLSEFTDTRGLIGQQGTRNFTFALLDPTTA